MITVDSPLPAALRAAIAASLLACTGLALAQEVGGGSKGAVTGAAGGATSEGGNSTLERCDQALGTIGDVTSVPALLQALKTPNTDVWHSAAESLWLMNEDVMPHVIVALTSRDHDTRRVALQAALWLTAEYDDDEVNDRDDYEWRDAWGWWN